MHSNLTVPQGHGDVRLPCMEAENLRTKASTEEFNSKPIFDCAVTVIMLVLMASGWGEGP